MIKKQPSAWISGLYRMRFMQLFVFTCAAMVLHASFPDALWVGFVTYVLYLNALWVTLSEKQHRFKPLLIGLWLLMLLTRLWVPAGQEENFAVLSKSLGCLLLLACITSMSGYVFTRQRVTSDSLFGVVVIYMLIAFLFATVYSIIALLIPGSFSYPQYLAHENDTLQYISFQYFSFVTIATLGYGDILPSHPVTQMLASIEAVVGQFYVAIVVARMVSVHVSARHHHDRPV